MKQHRLHCRMCDRLTRAAVAYFAAKNKYMCILACASAGCQARDTTDVRHMLCFFFSHDTLLAARFLERNRKYHRSMTSCSVASSRCHELRTKKVSQLLKQSTHVWVAVHTALELDERIVLQMDVLFWSSPSSGKQPSVKKLLTTFHAFDRIF